MQFVLFTDNLADLTISEVCTAAKQAGFDGLDLTVRPGGHVKPGNVELELSAARRAADAAGMAIPMITTALTDVDSPHAEAVFASAAHYGVRYIKLGYWPYQPFGTAAKQIDDARAKLARLAKLGTKYNVLPCVHCHSGRILANGGATLYLILRDFKPTEAAAYVDTMHMTVEGGLAGWEMGLDLLAPWVRLVGVKNFRWVEGGRDDKKQMKFRAEYVPLADGQARLADFMAYLKQLKYEGVVSLHSEYKEDGSFRQLDTKELLAQSAADLAYLKSVIGQPAR